METNQALQEIFGRKSNMVAKLLATVPVEQRGMLTLCLAVGRADGDGAEAFRLAAENIINSHR